LKQNIYHLLKGRFLISEHAFKNWVFIIFLSVLGLIMISSAHSADRKVHKIAKISNEVKELKSVFVETRSEVMKVKMESKMVQAMADRELKQSEIPPYKIVVKQQEKEK